MNSKKRFFKVVKNNMESCYTGQRYEPNTTYYADDNHITIGGNGFQFSDSLTMLSLLFGDKLPNDDYHVLEVVPGNRLAYDKESHKYCSDEIYVMTHVHYLEIDRIYAQELEQLLCGNKLERLAVATITCDRTALRQLINDEDYDVRTAALNRLLKLEEPQDEHPNQWIHNLVNNWWL